MRRLISLHFLLFSVLVWNSCSKEKDVVDDVESASELISDLEKSPELLHGSWNLSEGNPIEGRESVNCEAKNIHFLENDSFYLQYQDKRIKGTYEITGATTINLSVGSTLIGTVSNTLFDNNKISLELDLPEDCSGVYDGDKYFRIHQFVWEVLNEFYLWQAEVDDLSDNIKPVGSVAYNQLVSSYPEPEAFFESLKHPDDKFSQIRSNYEDLENAIKGIDASNGVEFILSQYGSNGSVLGFVTHILEDSDAVDKDIQRGDIFIGVDGQSLNLNNYVQLLFDDKLSYTLNMADLNNSVLSLNGKDIELTKIENFQTNPIQVNKIIETGGKKIAYLMYTQFAQGFDQELNNVFAEYRAEGVDELILDLRYNGGGLTSTALYLGGMITGQFTGQIFAQKIWNKKVTDYYESLNNTDWMKDLFVSEMVDETAINSLNLNRVYVITTGRTASASEMVINGLAPFINVIQVGDTTYGKNVGGLAVVYDYIDNQGTINPDHTYAVSPITFSVANSEGFSDYADGLQPTDGFTLTEDIKNLGVLGETNEPMLALALNDILANSARFTISPPQFPVENVIDDPDFLKSSLLFIYQKDLP